MDNKVVEIINIIESKKDEYPNISKIWIKYIEEQVKSINDTLNKAEEIFKNIENDASQESILLLYLLYTNTNRNIYDLL